MKAWVEGLEAASAEERRWWGEGIKRGAAVEIFHACARFITVTGWDGIGDCETDISAVVEWLMERADERKTIEGKAERSEDDGLSLRGHIEDVIAALGVIPNDDLGWDDWSKIGMAIWGATGGSEDGYEAFREWSAKSGKHDDAACRERWDHWMRSPPDRLGIGTLLYEANKADPEWVKPSRRAPGESVASGIPAGGDGAPGRGRLAELAARVIYIQELHRYLDRETFLLLDEPRLKQIANRMGIEGAKSQGAKGVTARLSLPGSGMLFAVRPTMRPGQGVMVEEPWGACANTWRPSALKPRAGATAEDAAVWLAHAEAMIPNADDRGRVLDRMAWGLQNLGRKINSALVLLGAQETGKDSFLAPFWAALGEHNRKVQPGARLGGQFNDYMVAPWLLISEMPPAHKKDAYEELKVVTAEPPEVIRINLKSTHPYEIPNILNVIVTTNHIGAIALERDDRRFDIIATVAAITGDRKAVSEYYKTLHEWYGAGGKEAVAGYLLARNVSAFGPYERPPMTEAKKIMTREGAHPAVGWVTRLWDEEQPLHGRDYVTVGEILTRGQRGEWGAGDAVARGMTWAHVVAGLRLLDWVLLSKQIVDGPRRARVWARPGVAVLAEQVSAEKLMETLVGDRGKPPEDQEFSKVES